MGKKCQNYGFGYISGFGLVWFGFGYVQITHLRSPLHSPAQVHAFWYSTRHCIPEIDRNHTFGNIFWFSLVWFGFNFSFCPNPESPVRAGSNDTSNSPIGLEMPEKQWGTHLISYSEFEMRSTSCRHNSQHLLRHLLENLTKYKFYGHENPSEKGIKRHNSGLFIK